ncbi:uncharacterized protein FOMMEDRAFT_30628 [Fomitiporia mediterranea MF3/22]|uniref:uncharacterized protein n=1 Tax=Fomitiporia mediterranea (strain MF3/22) TaxID=694068 RepID=UPI0004408544|nr:uncharacterized protein FOMMEDRAFT_30628 [Fomitiporia mediterranea MF3/22]EJD00662.1 hypothetical protein FOMMEDRAFT_30628 [Fomitiporia mediterranea MF3/22]
MKSLIPVVVSLTLAASALAQLGVTFNPPTPTQCGVERIIMNGGTLCLLQHPILFITGKGAAKTEIYTTQSNTFTWTEDFRAGVTVGVHVEGFGRKGKAKGDIPGVRVAAGRSGCNLVS